MVGISQWSGDVLLDSSDTCFGTPGSLDHNDGGRAVAFVRGADGAFREKVFKVRETRSQGRF